MSYMAKLTRAQKALRRLDWIERDTLAGLFSRAWEDEIHGVLPGKGPTNKQLREWMDAAERKIIAELRKIKVKEYNGYKDGQKTNLSIGERQMNDGPRTWLVCGHWVEPSNADHCSTCLKKKLDDALLQVSELQKALQVAFSEMCHHANDDGCWS